MELDFVGQAASGKGALDHGLQGLEIVTTAQGTFLLSTTGAAGGLVSYALGATGAARVVDTQTFPGTLSDTASQMVDALQVGHGLQVAIGSTAQGALIGYAMSQTGQIGAAGTAMTLPGVGQAVDCAGVSLDGGTMVYVVDGATGGLSAHNAAPGTAQAGAGPVWQSGGADGFDRVETIEIGGRSVVLATGAGLDGVVSYQVDAATGALHRADTLGADDGIGIGIPADMVTVSAHGGQFAILAGAGSGSLTVMRVAANGSLAATDHLLDSLHTRFGGVQAVEAVEAGGHVFVVAGGADDGLSLFSLLPDGRLVHLQSLPHDTGTGLMNVSQIAAAEVGDSLQIAVGSQNAGGVAQFSVSLADLGRIVGDSGASVTLSGSGGDDLLMSWAGNDTLRGNGGDDILVAGAGNTQMWGGWGADIFVLRDGGHTVTIRDFQPGLDRLDMSDFLLLRGIDQLQVSSTSWGARIVFGDDIVHVQSKAGGALDAGDIFGALGLTGPTRLLPFEVTLEPDAPTTPDTLTSTPVPFVPLPPSPPVPQPDPGPASGPDGPRLPFYTPLAIDSPFGLTIPEATGTAPAFGGWFDTDYTGNDWNNLRYGTDGNDRMALMGGADQAFAGGGRDRILGGAGDDTLGGGWGHDTLDGGAGRDLLLGAGGHDMLRGGGGADQIWAGAGDDTVAGGWGDDVLGGALGDDTLLGDAGHDALWGGYGHDRLVGGAGDDTLGGFLGDDTLLGGDGRDELWGAAGDDFLWGDTGDDFLGAGPGRDSVSGGGGADMVFAGDGGDLVHGGWGDDTVYGAGGRDTIAGGGGADRLFGGGGQDVLMGGAGNDVLLGGTGSDTLLGGDGADIFVFGRDEGADLIVDFRDGADRIRLRDVDAFADLDIAATVDGGTLIAAAGTEIYLDGIGPGQLGAGDFLFG